MGPNERKFLKILGRTSYTLGPIGAAVVLVWVGFWHLLDICLFPQKPVVSAIACIGLATILAIVCHAWTMSNVPKDGTGYVFLTAALAVSYWRGVWKLWDSLVFAENPLVQSLLALGMGVSILMLTGNFMPTVVGPPILFPKDDHDVTMDDSIVFSPMHNNAQDELSVPFHNDFDEDETMIAMAEVRTVSN